jgi:cyclic pyranopterin phosphate synthase
MPEERIPRLDHSEILRYEEILRIIRIGISLGISKIRITGGEPLVRKGVYPFLDRLNRMGGLRDVSLTTNGILLAENIDRIYQSGIRRINVSIDTLDRNRYRQITGVDGLPRVWRGIEAALEKGFSPIKLNVVALKGINEDELVELARLSFEYPFHIRFIEQMPIGNSQAAPGKLLLAPVIKQRIGTLGQLRKVERTIHDGPAQRYRLEGAIGEVGFIPAISQHFCERCNRLRLTASGQLRPCLLSDLQQDLKGPLRAGCSDDDIIDIFLKAVRLKPCDHHLIENNADNTCSGQMHAIGG